jgi:hypothetical protein
LWAAIPRTREIRNPQPLGLRFRALLADGNAKVRFHHDESDWIG